MRSNQAALQLGSELKRYMARCQCAEAGGDAVHRSRVLGERFDVGATRSDRGESVIRDHHSGVVACHAQDVVDGDRADPDHNRRAWIYSVIR